MKKLWIILLAIVAISACKKDSTTPTNNPCKMTGYVIATDSYKDSTVISYSTDSVIYITYASSGINYKYRYIKSGSNYNFTIAQIFPTYLQTNNGVIQLNGWGYTDTAYRFNSVTTLLNYTAKNIYDGNGYLIKYTNKYIAGTTYSNIGTFYINGDGNINYERYLQYNYTTVTTTRNDSIVLEYYTSLINRAPIEYPEQFIYGGSLTSNLVKKQTYYDYLNGNAVRKIVNYAYTLNPDNYVTQYLITTNNYLPSVSTTVDTVRLYYTCP